MQAGQPLHGNLAGCRKLKNRKMDLRIVFTPNKDHKDYCYWKAKKR